MSSYTMNVFGQFFLWAHSNMPSYINWIIDLIVFWLKKIRWTNEIPHLFCINKEWLTKYNIRYESFFEKKKPWISGICRVRNGDDFLEIVLESYLFLCDEIIIVDNNSTDNTADIAKKMAAKYPDRIRYYTYPFDTTTILEPEFSSTGTNSIYSFAYASNYAMSLAQYKRIIKVDDDNLLIQERALALRDKVLSTDSDVYINIRWINIMQKDGQFGISKHIPYSGRADHGIFPLSAKTYFVQGKTHERLVHPYRRKRFWFLFIHLKLLKKDMWWVNYKDTIKKAKIQKIRQAWTIKIEAILNNHMGKLTKQTLSIYLHQ